MQSLVVGVSKKTGLISVSLEEFLDQVFHGRLLETGGKDAGKAPQHYAPSGYPAGYRSLCTSETLRLSCDIRIDGCQQYLTDNSRAYRKAAGSATANPRISAGRRNSMATGR